MNLETFNRMRKRDLLTYLEFLLREYRLVDSFWFLSVEEIYGRESAERMNGRVWAQMGSRTVRALKKAFEIKEKGLDGLFKVLALLPWSSIGDHSIQRTGREIILSVPRCPPQVARLKQGLGEYACKEMHRVEFAAAVREVDPRIKVICEFAPPDPHPDELFCNWKFTM